MTFLELFVKYLEILPQCLVDVILIFFVDLQNFKFEMYNSFRIVDL